jgi:hypothetical protein
MIKTPELKILPAAKNSEWTLAINIPFEDADGLERTAILTLEKHRLWETPDGAILRGVRVAWKEGTG